MADQRSSEFPVVTSLSGTEYLLCLQGGANKIVTPNLLKDFTSSTPVFASTVTISNTGSLVFEGSTDNEFETVVGVVDPTADRTINFPNASGTLALTTDIPSSLSGGDTNKIPYQTAPSTTSFIAAPTVDNTYLKWANTGGFSWVTLSDATVSVTNDTSTDSSFYVGLSSITTGSLATITTSSSKLYFNPSTGTLSSTVFNSLSDSRLKSDVVRIRNALDTIAELEGVSFVWKGSNKLSYGVIAQDIEKTIPALVSTEEYKTVNYNGIIGFLIEAIKELKLKVELLESR